jgi:hypothetical protein
MKGEIEFGDIDECDRVWELHGNTGAKLTQYGMKETDSS